MFEHCLFDKSWSKRSKTSKISTRYKSSNGDSALSENYQSSIAQDAFCTSGMLKIVEFDQPHMDKLSVNQYLLFWELLTEHAHQIWQVLKCSNLSELLLHVNGFIVQGARNSNEMVIKSYGT